MSSAQYGRVSGGKRNLRDDEDGLVDEWGVRYEGKQRPGGGKFTLPRKRNNRRIYLYMVAGAIVALILIIIIAVAVQKHSQPIPAHLKEHRQFEKRENKTKGLQFYPAPDDGSVLMTFSQRMNFKEGGYGSLVNSMEKTLTPYLLSHQQDDIFVECNSTYAPADKVCQFETSVFHPGCTIFDEFGYSSGTPCVLLQLVLPDNAKAEPLAKEHELSKKLGDRWSPNHIGVTCEGATINDQQKMTLPHDKIFHSPITYFPPKGFPTYYFRETTTDRFLAPIMMVRFNRLSDHEYIRINCTAWGKNIWESPAYSTSFVFYFS